MYFLLSKRKFTLTFSVLIAAFLLLSACAEGVAAEPLAAIEMQLEAQVESDQAEAESPKAPSAGEEQAAEAAVEVEGESSVEADSAEADVEAAAEVGYPQIVPGDAEFHETDPATVSLASGQVQFIEFFAYWCPTCKAMAPAVHGLETIYGERINFIYLDRDNPSTAQLREVLGYVYQPHFFLLSAEGAVLGSWVGYVDPYLLQDAIELSIQ